MNTSNAAQDFITISCSDYVGFGKHLATEFVIYDKYDINLATPLYNQVDTVNKKVHRTEVPNLHNLSDLKVMVRHFSDSGMISEFSAYYSITIDTGATTLLEKFQDYADDQANPVPILADYTTLGVADVTTTAEVSLANTYIALSNSSALNSVLRIKAVAGSGVNAGKETTGDVQVGMYYGGGIVVTTNGTTGLISDVQDAPTGLK